MQCLPRDDAGFRLRGADRQADALGLDALERFETPAERVAMLTLAAVGALSAVIATVAPTTTFGLPGWIYMLIPIFMAVHGTTAKRRRRGVVAGAAAGAPVEGP